MNQMVNTKLISSTDETSDTLNEDSLNLEASFKREEKKKEEDQTTKRSVCL